MGLKVLSALDAARTQYYHFKAIIIAGMGLFTDAYDLFCIPPVMRLIGHVYYNDRKNTNQVPAPVTSTMMVMALLGTVIGQLVFGCLGDRKGRRKVYGVALMLMVFSSIGCGFSVCRTRTCVLFSLGLFRFLLGVGIGGDYPLSATIMSEFASKTTRGAFIAAVFSMQGFGILVSSTVTMTVCGIFNRRPSSSNSTPEVADLAWRLIFMIGAVPAMLTFYWRMMMPETARYTALVEKNVKQAARDMEKILDVSMSEIAEEIESPTSSTTNMTTSYSLCSRNFLLGHGRDLLGCSIAWFLVDVVFYSNNLFQSQIYRKYLPDHQGMNAFQEAYHVAKLQAVVAVCSTIPGYFATVYFIDRIGRVRIQFMGFLFMGMALLAIAIPYNLYWDKRINLGFMFLYGLTFFFANFGPNTTTFIVPAELFPARFRSTCHGISGAVGKVGAIVGSVGFMWVSSQKQKQGNFGMMASLVVLAAVCFMGMLSTYLFTPETMGRSLEENEKDEVAAAHPPNNNNSFERPQAIQVSTYLT